jgi:tight adherence protein C
VGQHRQTVFENPVAAPLMGLGLVMAVRFGAVSIRARIRQDLSAAGNPQGYSVEEYLAICLLGGGGLAVAAVLILTLLGSSLALLIGPLAGIIGFYGPLWALSSAAHARVVRISKQLPYTLDLIALTMGAGSALTEAIETLIRDDPGEELNQELAIVLSEIGFGATMATAMHNLAQRIPLESLRSIVGAIVQSQKLGTTLSVILKDQADMMRSRRSVRAEKLSSSAGLRILVPSMLILIAVVLVVFAPLIIRMMLGTLY